MIETDNYEIPLNFYQKLEWYAEQMEVTVDYVLDEFFVCGCLLIPESCTPYEYECDS